MTVIKSLGVLSVARIIGVIGAGVGLLIGALLVARAFFAGPIGDFGPYGWMVFAAVPFIYAGVAFVGGALYAWLYNVVAGWVGGIEVEFEPE